MKYTMGPWVLKSAKANEGPGAPVETEIRGGGYVVARLGTLYSERQKADAALLAAAPELAEALKRAIPWLGKLIADGAHLNSVAPNDAIGALEQAEAIMKKVSS